MNAVIVFVKYPEKGFVKTRIAKDLGDDFTLGLYRNFIKDTLNTCEAIDSDTIIMLHSEKETETSIPLLRGYNCYRQEGADLGERMYNAFFKAFYFGYKKCVLIGSDIPDIPARHIIESLEALNSNDIVLGPTNDGGYYLVGVKKESADPELFSNIEWSTDSVFKETVKRIREKSMSVHLLENMNDIDTAGDLKSFFELHKNDPEKSCTMTFLFQNENIISSFLKIRERREPGVRQ